MMDHVITVRDIIEWSAITIGIVVVLGLALWFLSLFADAFKD